jgi:hypothetical protein
MTFEPLPESAAWRHTGLRDGFEVAFFRAGDHGHRFEGHTAAVEAGHAWTIHYTINVDRDWRTRDAEIMAWTSGGEASVHIESGGAGRWLVDGVHRPELEGCLDVDLESSALTNTIPVHRLALPVGGTASAPAAYVRALDLGVQILEQHYTQVQDDGALRFDYEAPQFDFRCRLLYDTAGLVVDYPGIATRVR